MKILSLLYTVGLLTISIFLVASCSPTAAPDDAPITFGMVAPMTGDAADYGTQLETGVRLAIEEINAAGGIDGRTVKLEICDDKCDPSEGSLCAQKMSSNKDIFAVIGHVCSSATLAGGPIYEKSGLTAMTVSSTNPEVTKKGWSHVFRTIAHDGMQGPLMAEFAVKKLGKTNLAIMYASTDYGKGLLDATLPSVSTVGGVVVATETYVPGVDKDFSAQLTKIAQANPDALLLLTDYSEGGLIAKQRLAAGLGDITVIASAGNQHQGFLSLGGEGAEGVYLMTYFDPEKPDQLTQDFVAKYNSQYTHMPSEQAGYGYEAPYIFKMAIEKGATKETMHEVLRTIEYTGLTGVTKFDSTGDVLSKGQAILIVKDGKFTSFIE